ncbi:hypothetical protein ACFSTC_55460 [Nonomuraea ferruginea]
MSAGKTLVLWDIDHTLITIGGLSHNIYAEAFQTATGQAMRQLADMTGRTERAITADTLRLHHIEVSAELLHSFGLALAESFLTFEEEIRKRGQAQAPGDELSLQMIDRTVERGHQPETGQVFGHGLDGRAPRVHPMCPSPSLKSRSPGCRASSGTRRSAPQLH